MKYENLEQANKIYGRVQMLNEERDKCTGIIESIEAEAENYVGVYTLLKRSRSATLNIKRHELLAFLRNLIQSIDDEKTELVAEFDKL